MSDGTTRFEVRKGAKNADRQNAMIQAGYDTVDRMAALLEGITFAELLTLPFKELVPRILLNVEQTAGYGLIDAPEEVVALFTRLMNAHGDDNFQNIAAKMCEDEAVLSRELFSPLWKLWFFHGVRLPEFSRFPDRNHGTKAAIDMLVEEAGEFGYRSIHETPGSKDLLAVKIAVHNAVENFIIYLPHNGLCCACTGTCHCVVGLSTDYCITFNGNCAAGSTTCGFAPIR